MMMMMTMMIMIMIMMMVVVVVVPTTTPPPSHTHKLAAGCTCNAGDLVIGPVVGEQQGEETAADDAREIG